MMIPSPARTLLDKNRFLRFGMVGGIGFAVDAGGLLLLMATVGIAPLPARLLSMFCAITVTWLLNRSFTFRSENPRSLREWLVYALCIGGGAVVNYGIYYAGLQLLPIADMHSRAVAAVIPATAIAMLVNYNVMRLFVFRPAT